MNKTVRITIAAIIIAVAALFVINDKSGSRAVAHNKAQETVVCELDGLQTCGYEVVVTPNEAYIEYQY